MWQWQSWWISITHSKKVIFDLFTQCADLDRVICINVNALSAKRLGTCHVTTVCQVQMSFAHHPNNCRSFIQISESFDQLSHDLFKVKLASFDLLMLCCINDTKCYFISIEVLLVANFIDYVLNKYIRCISTAPRDWGKFMHRMVIVLNHETPIFTRSIDTEFYCNQNECAATVSIESTSVPDTLVYDSRKYLASKEMWAKPTPKTTPFHFPSLFRFVIKSSVQSAVQMTKMHNESIKVDLRPIKWVQSTIKA